MKGGGIHRNPELLTNIVILKKRCARRSLLCFFEESKRCICLIRRFFVSCSSKESQAKGHIWNKEYFRYLRVLYRRISVTEEQFHEYYREIDSFRKKQQRYGKCICAKSKKLLCDMDYSTCPYRSIGDSLSFELTVSNRKFPLLADQIEIERLISQIGELMPEAIRIG